ncbi:alpha/beta fold hydrolase [Bordetella sp. N]|uniref:alpha/beta fold hydrolase n=1 Tax=Bordetella sp. N TaxID=1746199 RepID=UPI00070E747E|nr:alpha/beta hydrolase [Bordetella sp. N]ALM82191.1 chloroperoxidase [Bordetella sp. N]
MPNSQFSFAASRRHVLLGAAAAASSAGLLAAVTEAQAGQPPAAHPGNARTGGGTLITKDGTRLFYKDWGTGPTVVFSHGYPLSSDAWSAQMLYLMQRGYRVVAHDRRGFGRSSQPGTGYDFDTFADDLAELIEALDLKDITLVGHSMGGGEVARYLSRHGSHRVARLALVAAVTPFLLKTDSNPAGAPRAFFDSFRTAVETDRSQWNKEVSMPYYNFNRPGAKVSEGVRDDYWRQGQATGILAAYDAISAFSETDFRADLKKIRVPTLIIHGDDDQIVPLQISGQRSVELIKHAKLVVYKGGSHGLQYTHRDALNADLLAFAKV